MCPSVIEPKFFKKIWFWSAFVCIQAVLAVSLERMTLKRYLQSFSKATEADK